MYVLALALALGGALLLVRRGGRSRRAGWALGAATLAFFAGLGLWADALWFEAVGYANRFWRMVAFQAAAVACGTAIGCGGVRLIVGRRAGRPRRLGRGPEWLGGGLGALWGWGAWEEGVLFFYGAPTTLADPIYGLSTGFYLFALPILGQLLWLAAITLGVAALSLFGAQAFALAPRQDGWPELPRALLRFGGALALFFGGCAALSIPHLLYSEFGVVVGPGWVDVYIRPVALAAVGLLFAVLATATWLPSLRRRLPLPSARLRFGLGEPWCRLAGAWSGVALASLVTLVAVPALVQWLLVRPNEISFERPYLAHNIAFTRRGFGLHEAEVRQFPAAETLSRETVAKGRGLLDEARLWDQGALDAVYKQFQEIRLYYEFHDLDVDRYRIGDRYRQVMVSARELAHENLPEQSQTFVNQRFKYTHGYGATVAPVHDFTPDGLPKLLVKDVPPVSTAPELELRRPEIYYGELTHQPAVVRTLELEFDYPVGDQNAYTRYEGTGGVPLETLWRKFVFGWKLDGTPFLLSSYPRAEARVMFYREIRARARVLAPFLHFDADPYVVVYEGRLVWVLDAYTTSEYYPYSEPFEDREDLVGRNGERDHPTVSTAASGLDGVNYVRNAVKIVIDAYDGDVDLYVFEPDDPVVKAWERAFPNLFQPASAMPSGLRAHTRYPEAFLLAQGLMYRKYHMTDVEVFYNQEDLWVRATEKYGSGIQPVQPYYVMWTPPGGVAPEFGLVLPFTPRNRQVMIGWIAGLCDGDNYGRFIAYKFPKERRVLGPQQVESKIDQDRFLAAQLTLWDQRGSEVIRGNTLAIPLEDTLLYLQPIYLKAETAAYPELRLVVAMHGDHLSYGETFDEAMAGLLGDGPEHARPGDAPAAPPHQGRRARDAFERYLQHQGEGDFAAAAASLEELSRILDEMAGDDTARFPPADPQDR